MSDPRPLIAHIVFRFDVGGLENGIVNLVNGLPQERFRHAVIALTEATEFAKRLRPEVPVHALGKRPGKDPIAYWRLYRLLRRLRPAIVHTRNFGTLDCAVVAWLAGVPVRIHGEHGWDVLDPDGAKIKYQRLRRLLMRFVHVVVTVSEDLRRWLADVVGIVPAKIMQIYNGVDTQRFRPAEGTQRRRVLEDRFLPSTVVLGSVTRFSAIKDPLNLIGAFLRWRARYPERGDEVGLFMAGDGELHDLAVAELESAGAAAAAWLPGSRDDIPELLRSFDVFVLGSLREGISNTVLEAMATGLPVIASATGGNLELVVPGETGQLVPPGDRQALADAIAAYVDDPELRRRHGLRARERVCSQFSLAAMRAAYEALYDRSLSKARAGS